MAKGNQKSDTPTFVNRNDVMNLIHQEITQLGEARLALMMLEENQNSNQGVTAVTKVGDLHLSDKQALLTNINKKIKRLPNEY